MAVTAKWYGKAFLALANKEVDYLTDTIKVMLTTSTYTPNADTHDYKDDVTNEVTGTGYTAGGATLAFKTNTYTAANSWATAWAASTAYAVGDIVIPTVANGHLYMCVVAGTSAASQPTWPTVSGQTVADNTATWAEIGSGIIQFDAADVSWTTSTITARYAVVYDDTPATDATKPLLGYIDFGEDKVSSAGTFQITVHANGLLIIPVN